MGEKWLRELSGEKWLRELSGREVVKGVEWERSG